MKAPNKSPAVDIIIPTYNRAHLIGSAVRAALEQSWWNRLVTVIDDASSDGTEAILRPYFDRPDFNYIRLERNLGTAGAKNAGLLLTGNDAVTFHDSDDIPHRDKVLRQVRVLARDDINADDCLNWAMIDRPSGQRLNVDAVLTHHTLVLPDGRQVEIRRSLSLVDDVFPNLQMGSEVPGDWTHINSGLFREDVFARFGGFADCIEEDREFRNRLILNGAIVWIIPDLLLTKIETADSLTQSAASDYASPRRRADRAYVWDRVAEWRRTGRIAAVPIDLPHLGISHVSRPELLFRRALPMTEQTSRAISGILADHAKGNLASPVEAAE